MNVKWKGEGQKSPPPGALLQSLTESLASTKHAGSFKPGDDLLIDALFDYVDHQYEINKEVLYHIFRNCILQEYRKSLSLIPNKILSEFSRACSERLRKINKYILVTSMSFDNTYKPSQQTINDCTIVFRKSLPAKLAAQRLEFIEVRKDLSLSEQAGSLWVLVKLQAPDGQTAFTKAMESLDVFRAAWQLSVQKKIAFFHHLKSQVYPTNSILKTGKFHTLYSADDKDSNDLFWYEPDFSYEGPTKFDNFEKGQELVKSQISAIKKSRFPKKLFELLSSYINALDKHEHEFRFLKLSTTFENVVGSDKTDEIIKRGAFLYADRAEYKEILKSLRMSRNVNVHTGIAPCNVEMKNYRMCMFIETWLRFFIGNPLKFKTMTDVIKFISSPTEHANIDQQIKNLRAVKKFISN